LKYNPSSTLHPPRWLEWAQEIQALSQTSSHYSENEYQRGRCQRLLEISAEIISECGNLEYPILVNAFQAQIGYATPRIDVRGAVFRNNKLLLVRERVDGGWTMPGGWADVGNLPSMAVEREVWEEAGFHVIAQKVIGVYDANRTGPMEVFHAYKLVFFCEIIDGTARPSDETSEVDFFGSHEIPVTLSGERTKIRHIQDAFKTLFDHNSPTVFD